ncbi:unnamed protein product [Pleuronectes platessa]|uniref:Uncharacterized protein n=1 Tax=Pleuronectes platessa TaxID=8262 RepID=A0A9N7TQ71_PLEPL|nr:unnamed protein product [Pleuronectes platessa]
MTTFEALSRSVTSSSTPDSQGAQRGSGAEQKSLCSSLMLTPQRCQLKTDQEALYAKARKQSVRLGGGDGGKLEKKRVKEKKGGGGVGGRQESGEQGWKRGSTGKEADGGGK